MSKIVCFGEIMLRLNPPGNLRFVQAKEFQASYAGGEANVAVSLANYGVESSFVTKLPKHEIGQSALNALRQYGVGTNQILRGGDRLGIYFVEKGASQRASKVIYDREHAAIAVADPSEYDWPSILEGATWFHFTCITPALGEKAAQACMDAVKTAKDLGITVSCDLNYRKKLWSRDEAGRVMSTLMPYVDVCISNEEDAHDVFGISSEGTDIEKGEISREGYISVAKQLKDRFGFSKVAITLRGSLSASDNKWSGMLYEDGKAYFAPEYLIRIVDRVGSGDSFGGGLIYALMSNYSPQDAIEYAVAASCLKHSIECDFNLVSVDEVKSLAAGNASGRVQR
jgi:2-dehydro-3-deoxygluconokinase